MIKIPKEDFDKISKSEVNDRFCGQLPSYNDNSYRCYLKGRDEQQYITDLTNFQAKLMGRPNREEEEEEDSVIVPGEILELIERLQGPKDLKVKELNEVLSWIVNSTILK